jgi:hypothetical protein
LRFRKIFKKTLKKKNLIPQRNSWGFMEGSGANEAGGRLAPPFGFVPIIKRGGMGA